MFARPWLATAQRFVTLATEVANSLDFATVVREPRHPLAWRAETLRWLWWDLYAEGRKAGPSAIAMIEAGASIRDELAIAANSHDDGDLDPWLDRRDRVLELLGELHAAGPQDEPAEGDHDVVVRSAVVPATPSRPTQARPPAIGSDAQAPAGGKGEKAEKVAEGMPTSVVTLGIEEQRMLRVLRENDATSDADGARLRKEEVMEFGKMKPHAIRRAAKSLAEKGLVDSFGDRRGGYWLTPKGIEVASPPRP